MRLEDDSLIHRAVPEEVVQNSTSEHLLTEGDVMEGYRYYEEEYLPALQKEYDKLYEETYNEKLRLTAERLNIPLEKVERLYGRKEIWVEGVKHPDPFIHMEVLGEIGPRPDNILKTLAIIYISHFLGQAKLHGGNKTPPSRLYHKTNANLEDIEGSGRMIGRTEGSVYASKDPNPSLFKSGRAGENTIIFEGEAAAAFKPHRVEGIFSLYKRLGGQYKAGFGDLEL